MLPYQVVCALLRQNLLEGRNVMLGGDRSSCEIGGISSDGLRDIVKGDASGESAGIWRVKTKGLQQISLYSQRDDVVKDRSLWEREFRPIDSKRFTGARHVSQPFDDLNSALTRYKDPGFCNSP